jgi:hypothetical protein
MHKKLPIAFIAVSMLAIAGCTIGETPEATAPTPTTPPTAESPPEVEPFNTPVVPEPTASASANLIQPTNPTERERIISKGRDDPFAQIVGLTVSTPTTGTAPVEVSTVPRLPTPSGVISVPSRPTAPPDRTIPPTTPTTTAAVSTPQTTPQTTLPQPQRRPGSVLPTVMPGVLPNQELEAVLPPPPQPELAEGVFVSGVVLIGQKAQAIIKVPNEETSRYVEAGQRLGNGLLIKRIEMNEGSNPIVILEQYGIEVARMVGEQPVNSASSGNNSEAS